MYKRFLLTFGLLLALMVMAACGGNGDNGDNGEAVAEEDRDVFMLSTSGAVEQELQSSGFSAMCLREDQASGDEPELVILSLAGVRFLLYLQFSASLLQQGTGTYPLVDRADSADQVAFNFEISERSWSRDASGEVTIERIPASEGETFALTLNVDEMTNADGETISLTGSVHVPINSENTLTNCFGLDV
ncbi:MAG: hypothetical protein EA396_10365 [Anaerolineaceae bacterium]|nr:MAG: hypothetical protein EA396_10365 [Anaerolineaceae bacterium]